MALKDFAPPSMHPFPLLDLDEGRGELRTPTRLLPSLFRVPTNPSPEANLAVTWGRSGLRQWGMSIHRHLYLAQHPPTFLGHSQAQHLPSLLHWLASP